MLSDVRRKTPTLSCPCKRLFSDEAHHGLVALFIATDLCRGAFALVNWLAGVRKIAILARTVSEAPRPTQSPSDRQVVVGRGGFATSAAAARSSLPESNRGAYRTHCNRLTDFGCWLIRPAD
jgi:hypothetical protein